MVKEEYIDIFGGSPEPKKKPKKSRKGLILILSILVIGLVGVVGVYAYTTYTKVSVPEITVYAETLGELKKKNSELKKKRLAVIKARNKAQKKKDKNNNILHPIKEAEYAKAIEQANKSIKSYDKAIADIEKKIFSMDEQKKISEEERSKSLNERDGGKKFAEAEWERTSSSEVDALNNTSVSDDSDDSSSDNSGSKAKSKSKEEKSKRKGKTVSNYQGGLSNGVNTDDTPREYVEDNRRSKTDAIRFISDDPATSALMESITNTVNSSIGGKYLLVYSTDGMLSFSNKIYRPMVDEDKKKVMELSLKTIKESQLPSKVKTKVTNFITDQDKSTAQTIQALNSDTSWELSKGYTWFVPFTGPISTLLGFLAIVIFVFLSSSIVFDIAYLTIGVFRSFLEDGEGKPKLITGEAWETSKEVDLSLQSGTYREYISVYFRKRVGIFIFTAVLLIYLISGQIYDISSWFLKVFEEIFKIRG